MSLKAIQTRLDLLDRMVPPTAEDQVDIEPKPWEPELSADAISTQMVAFADCNLVNDIDTLLSLTTLRDISQNTAMISVGLHSSLVMLIASRIDRTISWDSINRVTSEEDQTTLARVIAISYDGGIKLFVVPFILIGSVAARRIYVFHYVSAFETEEVTDTPNGEHHNTYKFYCAYFECSLLAESSTLGSIADTIATYGHEKNLWRKRK